MFLMGQGLNIKKCELMWQHISQKKKFKVVEIEKLMFEKPGGIKSKAHFTEDVLYSIGDFKNGPDKSFVLSKVSSRCNFMLVGNTNIFHLYQ